MKTVILALEDLTAAKNRVKPRASSRKRYCRYRSIDESGVQIFSWFVLASLCVVFDVLSSASAAPQLSSKSAILLAIDVSGTANHDVLCVVRNCDLRVKPW
jgi:hypothetical protein